MREGGSTITQQYVRLTSLNQEKTLRRKIQEAFLALRVESEMSKDEILLGYLNTAYFGAGAYGVDAAARRFVMRTEFVGDAAPDALAGDLVRRLPRGAHVRLAVPGARTVVILATKEAHCLGDLLLRHEEGDLPARVAAVVTRAEPAARADRRERWMSPVGRFMRTLTLTAGALVLVLPGALGGGVTGSPTLDGHGKTLGYHLLAMSVDDPSG